MIEPFVPMKPRALTWAERARVEELQLWLGCVAPCSNCGRAVLAVDRDRWDRCVRCRWAWRPVGPPATQFHYAPRQTA